MKGSYDDSAQNVEGKESGEGQRFQCLQDRDDEGGVEEGQKKLK